MHGGSGSSQEADRIWGRLLKVYGSDRVVSETCDARIRPRRRVKPRCRTQKMEAEGSGPRMWLAAFLFYSRSERSAFGMRRRRRIV